MAALGGDLRDLLARMEARLRRRVGASPIGDFLLRLENLFREPSLSSPDIRTLDSIWREVIEAEVYHHPGFQVRHGDAVIVDVGAHVGLFAAWVCARYRPRSVLSLEASPVTYRHLVRNLKRIAKKHVGVTLTPVHAAVSDAPDQTVTIFHQSDRTATSTLRPEGRGSGRPYAVRTTTLARQLTAHALETVDLLKIDVEGHFMQVLGGIGDEHFPRIRNLVIECDWVTGGAPGRSEVERFLGERGFKTEVDDPEKPNNIIVFAYR